MSDQDDLTAGTDGSAGDVPPHSPAAPPIQPPPVAEPGRREVKVDEHGDIAEAIECRACGYNLQGLSPAPGSLCPECSMPIARSIHGDELRFSDPKWVRSLAQGVLFILVGILSVVGASVLFVFGVIIYIAATQGAVNPAAILGLASLLALPSLLIIYGAWRLTSPDPGQTETEAVVSARKLARWCVMASLVAMPLQMMASQTGMNAVPTTTTTTTTTTGGGTTANVNVVMAGSMPFQLLNLLAQTISTVGFVAGLLYLARLARRIPHASLESQTRIVMWGYGITSGLGLLLGLITVIFLPSMVQQAANQANPTFGAGFIAFTAGSGILGCASIVFSIWALVLLFRFRAQFAAQADLAEANWTAA